MKESKLDRMKKVVRETIRDCEDLKKKKELTQKGEGQFLLAIIIEKILDE